VSRMRMFPQWQVAQLMSGFELTDGAPLWPSRVRVF
jgi:hypothetical protein